MRKISDSEILALTRLLQMETNGLSLANVSLNMIGEEELRKHAETSISSTQSRIKELQQFIRENNILSIQEVQ